MTYFLFVLVFYIIIIFFFVSLYWVSKFKNVGPLIDTQWMGQNG